MTVDARRFSEASATARMVSGRLSSPAILAVRIELEAELGGDHDVVAHRLPAPRPPAPRWCRGRRLSAVSKKVTPRS
jgi:hypothetical protein